jgi:spore coat protein U-like protein
MKSGVNTLRYNMYTDASRTNVWGSSSGLLSLLGPASLSVPLNAQGVGSVSQTIFGRINGGQQVLPPGLYQSSFAGTDARVTYQYLSLLNCLAILSPGISAPFTVRANILASCSVSASALDFGSVASLDQVRESTSVITATCPSGIPYAVALSGGNASATDPAQRKMAKGADLVVYGLYQDVQRAMPWGDAAGSNTRSLTGSGAAQSLTVYGRIPVQVTRPPGNYTDTIVVTLTY